MTPSSVSDEWLLAQQHLQRRDIDAAIAVCQTILSQEPLHSGAHLMLSTLSERRGQRRLSTQHALAAAEKMGSQSLRHVADVSLRLIHVGELDVSRRLIGKLDPTRLPAPAMLAEFAQQLSLLEQHDAALQFLDAARAQGLRGDWVDYLHGNFLKFVGRIDAAEQAYEASLATNPDYALSHLALAYLGLRHGGQSRITRLRASLARSGNDMAQRTFFGYALFKELDDVGDTDTAWAALAAGARLKRALVKHDAADETAMFDAIIASCPPGFVGAATEAGGRATPVFVLGLPRTGTSLLERILGGHADIVLGGELNDFPMQLKWSADHASDDFLDRNLAARIGTLDHAELGRRYLDHVAWRAPGARMFTDKNPGNFMLAGPILRALPHARIIHLRRNPMDSGFSNLKELFAGNAHAYSYDFGDFAAHYRNYSRLMAHWHALAPGRILDVNYEDMVSDPDAQARRVMAYLGLDYDASQIRVELSALPVSTASSAQVRQPIHTRNIGGWKRYAEPLAPLQALLGAG
jgi:tetratricopeptide (TPR) repeat protein